MKKIFTILLLLTTAGLYAQTYNNEWIDFSKTYYKFKIGADGLYRIPQSVIANAGLGSTPVQYFQLFHNGKEIPIYTSVSSGVLGPADYIEFWGHYNDGSADKPLYRNPSYQHTEKWSLQTDTAVYFLTVNPTGPTFHYTNSTNDTIGNVLPVEPYFMHKAGSYFRSQINAGFAAALEQNIYSSSYDIGEFWSSGYITKSNTLTDNQANLFIYNGGPNATFRFGAAGCADTLRNIQVKVNNIVVKDTAMNSFNDLVSGATIPVSSLNTSSTSFQFTNNSQATILNDKIVVSFYELTYPRQFNFGGAANFYFELAPKASGYFIKVTNFNYGGATPVLYDFVSGERYTAVIDASGNPTFLLPGSLSTRKLRLVSEDASNIATVNGMVAKNFINFSDPANQGDYIIISNPALYTGTSGNNPVIDYKNYRNSVAGGSFNAQVVDINELVDQFAFGIKKHPLSIKNFLNYARNFYSTLPKFAFLIGRGIAYNDYRNNESNPVVEALNLVPTFGFPASDMMLSSEDGAHSTAMTPIGRIGAISGAEVEIYLQKVKEYEQAQQSSPNTLDGRLWMKNVIHITGATDPYLESILCNYMSSYKAIISDTFYGANVYTFCSTSIDQDNQVSASQFPSLFSNGVSIVSYFGHSSQSTLGFNLDDPSVYNNQGKYPVFYINGCDAGNFFTFNPGRLTLNKTLSENYVFAKEKGSIAFVASTHFGVVTYLGILIDSLYGRMARSDYGRGIGIIQRDAAQDLITILPTDFLARAHAEEMTIHGDPALKLNNQDLPDYVVESSDVKISPSFISVADNSFTVNIHFHNIGKAVSDSVSILITRKYPDGSSTTLVHKKIRGIRYADSVQLTVPIIATRDKGQNSITVTVDDDNNIPEITYVNNTVTASVYIYQDELTPIYPYNYAIVNVPNQKLYASTANPFAPSTQYVMEIDTTELFNSPAKVSKNISSVGGVFEFDPGFTYRDSTVYYWRTSIVPGQNDQYHWNEFSFIYIDSNNSSPGFNQSHYFQHLKSTPSGMQLNSGRKWEFGTHLNNLFITQTMYPTGGTLDASFGVNVNSASIIASACLGHSLVFNVFDPVTFIPWKNVDASGNSLFLYGSASASCKPTRNYNFEFSYMNSASRKKIMDFMDLIPNGYYVVVRSFDYNAPNSYSATWRGDTTLYGPNNSLYHRLLQAGFATIDSLTFPRDWVLVYKKGDNGFTPQYKISQGIVDNLILSVDCPSPNLSASVLSPAFGPAKQWKQLHWRGSSLENPSTDSASVKIIGVDTSGNQSTLYTVGLNTQDFDISAINAAKYPLLQLQLTTTDSAHGTPYQLNYWRLNYVPVPEGALAPNIFLSMKDTLELGEKLQFGVAFKNVSKAAFDSMKITLNIIDKNNVTHIIQLPKKRPIVSGDTLKITYDIDTKDYPGLNTLYLDVNPNNDQPEQYHFNNFLYHTFYVKYDQTNPLLDVTFDNVHILNEDIVSAKPHIMIKLKDESKFLLLTDTSLFNVQIRYPDRSLHPYYFNTDTLRFTPASGSADNTATVDFYTFFNKQYNPDGDEYTLLVTGKDKTGNPAGAQYQVTFKIITKAMISNMLNYPNPFTTSTAFVFTITGSDVPQNIKIQILTITGKIVREITKDELGPLHVGRNITEFKWDGTDMYHQRLANGVYLYHVVTNLNGKSLDKYKAEGDNTDQYFNKGYGKMYLMR